MDAGMQDEQGYVKVLARDDDVINVAGHRLSTSAIEEAIEEHEDVEEAVVIGVPDELKGQVPLALFIMRKGNRWQFRQRWSVPLPIDHWEYI